MKKNGFTLRQYLGALAHDVPRALATAGRSDLSSNALPWARMHNRNETVIPTENGPGVDCNWEWTSDLYLPGLFQHYGRWLYKRALKDFPINLQEQPELMDASEKQQVSIVIGHRGLERLPLLLMTLKSIAGQKDCNFECIVVEQDNKPLIQDHLPGWVRYIYTPLPQADMAYSRSWTFNVGSDTARSDFIIFHDNDMLVPEVYASQMLRYHHQGYAFINLKRFVFYLDQESSRKMVEAGDLTIRPLIESVVQNLEAGGSFGADKQAYFDIGGFDEGFVGWGGEDNEFWERANTRKIYPYGYLPIVHLWHPPQKGKRQVDGLGADTFRYAGKRMVVDPRKRIDELRGK